jgi:hypothetical protein
VVADNRSDSSSGVGLTTPAIRVAAVSTSVAEKNARGPLPRVLGP